MANRMSNLEVLRMELYFAEKALAESEAKLLTGKRSKTIISAANQCTFWLNRVNFLKSKIYDKYLDRGLKQLLKK